MLTFLVHSVHDEEGRVHLNPSERMCFSTFRAVDVLYSIVISNVNAFVFDSTLIYYDYYRV